MRESASIAPTSRRAVFVGVAALVLFASACGSSSKSPAAPQGGTSTTARAATAAVSLGTLHRATGTPVKIGLLTTGSSCSGCTANFESPARAGRCRLAQRLQQRACRAPHDARRLRRQQRSRQGKRLREPDDQRQCRRSCARLERGQRDRVEDPPRRRHTGRQPFRNSTRVDTGSQVDVRDLRPPGADRHEPDRRRQATSAPRRSRSWSSMYRPRPTSTRRTPRSAPSKTPGIKFDVIPVPLGQADLTPEIQQIVANNPDGVVDIIGSDVTCIPALNALHQLGFQGTITTISYCITDAMRKAVAGEHREGHALSAPRHRSEIRRTRRCASMRPSSTSTRRARFLTATSLRSRSSKASRPSVSVRRT